MPDANKSQATREITSACAIWLNDRGFRPVETEVPVADKWIADLGSVCSPSRTEALRMRLIPRRPTREQTRCNPCIYNDWDKTFTTLPPRIACIIEVKTSCGDFRSDDKWTRLPVAHLQYLAVPLDLSRRIECPRGWGLLVKTAGAMRCRVVPIINPIADITSFLFQLLLRRDNFTRYARFREFARQQRSDDNEYTNRARASVILDGLLTVLESKVDIETVFPPGKYPNHLRRRLRDYLDGRLPAVAGMVADDFEDKEAL